MSSSEKKTDNDIFNLDLDEEDFQNQRIAIRYVRDDIAASISWTVFLFISKTQTVKLLDISSKGVAIESKKNLPLNKKVNLELYFNDGEQFTINAKIVHKNGKVTYGLVFDKFNNELGNHLLSSQNDLIFK